MKLKLMAGSLFLFGALLSCNEKKEAEKPLVGKEQGFDYRVDRFADIQILRYQIPGFDELTLKEKKLVYYLTQAGLAGRDIIWDQNYRHNLTIRKALENIHIQFTGDRATDDWKAFEAYLKRIWFSNGIHHHYSNDKIKPEFSADYLTFLLAETDTELKGEAFEVVFNDKDDKKVNKKKGVDIVASSAVNFYDPTLTDAEVEAYYKTAYKGPADRPIEAGLNSTLVRENGK
ncbi:MAG TPA: hypothetical protein VKZ93_08100, partial [Arenibacter sp.]|nr:hypothetical protein [Arenibacter sp.]